MIIKHPRRAEILEEIGKRCRAANINYYRIELMPHEQNGWDARFDVAGGNSMNELQFVRIVNSVRDEFGPK